MTAPSLTILVNGEANADSDCPIGVPVTLSAVVSGVPVQSYLWTVDTQPVGSALNFNGSGSPTSTNVTETITPNYQGSVLISLVVNQKNAATILQATAVIGVRFLMTQTRAPAVGETIETGSDGWADETNKTIAVVDSVRADPGVEVMVIGSGAQIDSVVCFPSSSVIMSGLPQQKTLPTAFIASAAAGQNISQPLGIVVGPVSGTSGGGVVSGTLINVRRWGEHVFTFGGPFTAGQQLYLTNTGQVSPTPGTQPRPIALAQGGRSAYVDGTGFVSGSGNGINSLVGDTVGSGVGAITTTVVGLQTVPIVTGSYFQGKQLSYSGSSWTPQFNNGPVYNVVDWGLSPFGFLGCDAAFTAISASIAASGAPATIVFPPGTYLFHNAIPPFPGQCIFTGLEYGPSTTIVCDGIGDASGSFWLMTNAQTVQNLRFLNNYQLPGTTSWGAPLYNNPGQAVPIASASAGAGGVIEITTAVTHPYVTGDKIGLYDVQGVTSSLNCDPATPWNIAVIDPTHFTCVPDAHRNALFGGTFTVTPISISNVSSVAFGSNPSLNKITTSAPHGLKNFQLINISGVTGTGGLPANVNGAQRVYIIIDANNFIIARNVQNEFQAFVGAYSGGGTLTYGGVALSYSHTPQVCLDLYGDHPASGGASTVKIMNCTFGGYKYPISCDASEVTKIEDCQFNWVGYGYGQDQNTNDSTHSPACIRIGAFRTYNTLGPDFANVIEINRCQFESYYVGVYHHDGVTHRVSNSNYENQVAAIIGYNCLNIVYDTCENDGSSDSLGVFQFKQDSVHSGIIQNIMFNNCIMSSATAIGMIWIGTSLVNSLTAQNCQYLYTGTGTSVLVATNGNMGDGLNVQGGNLVGGNLTDGCNSLINRTSQNAFNGGFTVNHAFPAAASLDVGFYPYNGLSPAVWPGIILRTPNLPNQVFHVKEWAPTNQYYGGNFQEHNTILSTFGSIGSRVTTSTGFTKFLTGSNTATIGMAEVPNTFGTGIVKMTVQAAIDEQEDTSSFWIITKRYTQQGTTFKLGAITDFEVNDPIGLSTPILTSSGLFGSTIMVGVVSSSLTQAIDYSVKIELNHLGA